MNITPSQQKAQAARLKFATAFQGTLIKIWRERIALLKIIKTGVLYNSVRSVSGLINNQATNLLYKEEFKEHGIFQNYGVGRDTPKGNPGDIGHQKLRKPRHWFDTKYAASIFNLRDFLCDNLAQESIGIISKISSSSKK